MKTFALIVSLAFAEPHPEKGYERKEVRFPAVHESLDSCTNAVAFMFTMSWQAEARWQATGGGDLDKRPKVVVGFNCRELANSEPGESL